MENIVTGPAWDISREYTGIKSIQFQDDRKAALERIVAIHATCERLKPLMATILLSRRTTDSVRLSPAQEAELISGLQEISARRAEASDLLGNLSTWCHCEVCVDAGNQEAQRMASVLQQDLARLDEAMKPAQLFLARAPEELIPLYLAHPTTEPEAFQVRQRRKLRHTLLSEGEETLLTSMSVSGHAAWGTLYNNVGGKLRCGLEDGREIGLAEASGLLRSPDNAVRESAWRAINAAWQTQEESCASILNSLAGWRLELARKRSHTSPVDFLTHPLHSNRIERETLEAMFSAIRDAVEIPRRAMRSLATGFGKGRLDPWDLLAPPPETADETADAVAAGGSNKVPFARGLRLVTDSFAQVHPQLADFVKTASASNWLEGRVLPNKRQGAFCTRFPKSRTPRVFQTYMGTVYDIKTLAHELGHAFHGWTLRDLPAVLHRYPMSLAETASVFAESALSDHLMHTAENDRDRLAVAWQEALAATSFLLNIPARFDFERRFYERRSVQTFSPDDFRQLMKESWQTWYGDTLTEMDDMYWASKLHFHLASTSFYNFPYAFGYLFSLGLYSRRVQEGENFHAAYVALLRDTGRMTAEDLIRKHLGEDITQPAFWKGSLAIVETKVNEFEKLSRRFGKPMDH